MRPALTEMTANTGQNRAPDLGKLREFIAERDRNAAWFFVGRTAEIAEIEDTCALAFRRFREGKALAGATRLFQGAPGAGKTALLMHLQKKWAQTGDGKPHPLLVDRPTLDDPAALVLAIAELLDPDKAQRFRQTVTRGRAATVGVGPLSGSGTQATATSPPLAGLSELRRMFPPADWDRPVCLMVDEIQNLEPGEGKMLESLHLAVDGLPIVPVLAGLSSSQAVLTGQGGISRLSDRSVFTVGCLDAGQAAEAVRRMLASFCIEAEDSDAERWATLLECISDRWPQHLQNAMQALGEGLLEVGGVLAKVDERAVTGHARARRLDSYERRVSQEMRDGVILVGNLMAAVRDNGLHRHQVIDTIRARIRDRPEGSSARHLPEGMSPTGFLNHLVHRGALQEGEDHRLVCPIPSFRLFLIGEAVRTMFDKNEFMLEGIGEHSPTEHDARLLTEMGREPEPTDPAG